MSESAKSPLAPGLYRTPFSRAYWRDAAQEFKSVKMLALAAVIIAARVGCRVLEIPLSPNLKISFAFFFNALGAMIYGPVVAIPAAAVSDTLGCILFPKGAYFFPFIFVDISSSLIFALFLYRAPLKGWRVVLSRFAVCFLVNIVIQTPIMLWYYKLYVGTAYAIFDLPRIAKNLCLFPFESLLLLLFLNAVRPVTYRQKLTYDPPEKLKITKSVVALVLSLFLVGAAATGAYYVYDYNTGNHTTLFSEKERADFNRDLAARIGADEDELVLVSKIHRTVFHSEQEVTYTVYKIDREALTDDEEAALWSKKNSDAKEIGALTLVEKNLVLVIDGG